MSDDKKNVMATLAQEFQQLGVARDELRLQLRLARAEAKDEWERLERTWERLEIELKQVGDHAKVPAKEVSIAVRNLMSELRRSYERVKAELKS